MRRPQRHVHWQPTPVRPLGRHVVVVNDPLDRHHTLGDYPRGEYLAYTLQMSSAPAYCLGNADHAEPGRVDFADIISVLANFGPADLAGLGAGDADCDGEVNFADITFVLANFVNECP